MQKKTNVMRILEQAKIKFNSYEYDVKDGLIDAVSVANKTGEQVEKVFKTLVTQGKSKNYFVFVIPADKELDLKKGAKAVNEKSIEMIKVADINKVTGYIRGGCSPIGMKKQYKTAIDISAKNHDLILVSGGKKGTQVELNPIKMAEFTEAIFGDITK